MYPMTTEALARARDAELRARCLRDSRLRGARDAARAGGRPAAAVRAAIGYRLVLLGWRMLDGAGRGWAQESARPV